jgi:CO dehydrogenase maturation factor
MNTIAIAGKGGTGKTTICSLIIQWLLKEKKGSVLAIDADPNSNLGDLLGVKPAESIVELIDAIMEKPSTIPAGMSKNDFIEMRIQGMIAESAGFDLLVMGRPEGSGCYCYANNTLRDVLSKISGAYDYVLIDNEAGMEHLSRRTMRSADTMFIVTDYTAVSVRSAKRIFDLVKELKIKVKNIYLLVNRFKKSIVELEDEIKSTRIPLAGYLPEDETLNRMAALNQPLINAKVDFKIFKELAQILKEKL